MSNRDFAQEAETIISASVKVEGDFVSEGNVLIEGSVEGSLRTQKDLRVGENAKIAASVAAASAVIAGEVKGNVTVVDRLELEATARILGDVTTKILVVASGAVVNGKLTMTTPAAVERIPAAVAKKPRAAVVEAEEEIEEVNDEQEETISAMATAHAPAAMANEDEKKKSFNPFFTN